jgi:hypothetical protein
MARALENVGRYAFTPERRAFVARRQKVIDASPELREREALKNLALTAATIDALKRRGVSDLSARVAAELGALSSRIAYERWSEATGGEEFGVIARHVLDEVQAAALR